MMRSLFSGVSGLKSHQTRMDVIGNNIANINTVGFKSSRTTFSDILSQTTKGAASSTTALGGTNPVQIGLGAAVASIDLITSDGSPQSTGKNTDVALSGNGMFVLKNGDQYFYSRDGAFEFDNAGNYVLPGSGLYVQGWNAVDGSLNTNSDPTNIVVPAGRAMEATSTSSVDFSGNLNASAPTIQSITYTQGGSGADTTLVVTESNEITSASYKATFSKNATNTSTVYSFDSATASAGAYTTTNSAGVSGTVTKITLTLASGATEEIATSDTTGYQLGATYSGSTIAAITAEYTTGSQSIAVSDTATYTVGAVASSATTTLNVAASDVDVASLTYAYSYDVYATDTSTGYVFGNAGTATAPAVPTESLVAGTETYSISAMQVTFTDGSTANITASSADNLKTTSFSLGETMTSPIASINGKTVASIKVTYKSSYITVTDASDVKTTDFTVTAGTDSTVDSVDLKYATNSVNVDGKNVIAAVLTLSDGTTQKVTSGFYQVGHSIPITTIVTLYDSEGKTHAVTMLLDKDPVSTDAGANSDDQELGNDNRWRVYVAPAEGTQGPATGFETDEEDGSHTSGSFNNGSPSYIYFNNDGSYSTSATQGGSLYLTYSNGNGADLTTSSVDYTGLTQFAGSSTAYPTADGNSYGVLQSVSIDSSGILTGTYTNGTRRFEAQIAARSSSTLQV